MMKFTGQIQTEPKSTVHFQSEPYDESELNDQDLLKLIPVGIQISADGNRPMLLLKEEKGEQVMPVALNPLEAGVALSQANKSVAPTTPHKVTEVLLESLHMHIDSCVFVEIRGSHQYVRLLLKGHPKLPFLKVKAEDAMSLCLYLNVPLYATASFMARSRVLSAEIEGISKGLKLNPKVLIRSHKYVM